ncbi:MAG: ESX secretion-associated protein EspG [Nocardioides sp.]
MVTVDLGTPPAPPVTTLDGLPRRLPMTLPELRLAAEKAGGAPLPFEMTVPTTTNLEDRLADRLGQTRGTAEEAAYAAALGALHEPEGSLERRGLLVDGRLEPSLAGAIGLLATPTLAVDFDVVVEGVQVKAWHRQSAQGVATLSTADGIVFELAWLLASQWGEEMSRVAELPGELPLRASGVPAEVDVPFELLDAAGEALHSGRGDLVPVLADHHSGSVVEGDRPVPDADVTGLLQTLSRESRGRLRALVANVSGGTPTVVGVLSWLLLSDGWHALETHTGAGDAPLVRVRAVDASDVALALSPLMAEVSS